MAGNFSMAKGGQKCEPYGLLPTHPAHTGLVFSDFASAMANFATP
jgi:hypothetical protein